MNPLKALGQYGQSVWLDYIRRNLITSGELQHLIEEDGLGGVTSNPAIFEKAITGSTDYARDLEVLGQKDLSAMARYEALAIQDIQDAADLLRPVYDQTHRRDGYVSLEVSPYLAHDTQSTIEEARRLWRNVGRDNVMIKVPATPEGLPAIELLIGEGININVTLLFPQETYEHVTLAYIAGLERMAGQGGDVSKIGSVASFFVSRIDSAVDAMLEVRLKASTNPSEVALLRSLLGKVAIANAKLAYQRYKEIFRGNRWQALARKGAHTQRVLWASTSTKNPQYRDVLYVEELIGPDTVNTMPPATLDAFRDHGRLRASLEEDLDAAHETLETLARVGISLQTVTDQVLRDAVRLFAEPFDKLLSAVEGQGRVPSCAHVDRQTYTLSDKFTAQVKATLDEWRLSTFLCDTSWSGSGTWLARSGRARGSLPSPIRARDSRRLRKAAASVIFSMVCRASGAAIRPSPISGWCRRPSWASTP